MRKKNLSKIALNKETIRSLETRRGLEILQNIAGANSVSYSEWNPCEMNGFCTSVTAPNDPTR